MLDFIIPDALHDLHGIGTLETERVDCHPDFGVAHFSNRAPHGTQTFVAFADAGMYKTMPGLQRMRKGVGVDFLHVDKTLFDAVAPSIDRSQSNGSMHYTSFTPKNGEPGGAYSGSGKIGKAAGEKTAGGIPQGEMIVPAGRDLADGVVPGPKRMSRKEMLQDRQPRNDDPRPGLDGPEESGAMPLKDPGKDQKANEAGKVDDSEGKAKGGPMGEGRLPDPPMLGPPAKPPDVPMPKGPLIIPKPKQPLPPPASGEDQSPNESAESPGEKEQEKENGTESANEDPNSAEMEKEDKAERGEVVKEQATPSGEE